MLTDGTAQCYSAIKVLDTTEHSSALRLLCCTNTKMAQAQEHMLSHRPPPHRTPSIHPTLCPRPQCSHLRSNTNNPLNKLTQIMFSQCPALTLSPGCLFPSVTTKSIPGGAGGTPAPQQGTGAAHAGKRSAHTSTGATPDSARGPCTSSL